MEDLTGLASHRVIVSAVAPTTNSTGTHGYPQHRYARGKLGSVIRMRIMETTANP
jgi:hypothetical protein